VKNVLFLCRTNGCLSLMAEAYMGIAGRGLWRPWSAGIRPTSEVHRGLPEILLRVGIRKRGLHPKSWQTFAVAGAPPIDLAVLMREDLVPVAWPPLPGIIDRRTWAFPSLAGTHGGSGDHRQRLLDIFSEVRRQIDSFLLADPAARRLIA
jgi:arsenate reductase